jgi:fatty acid-binding protein DegV
MLSIKPIVEIRDGKVEPESKQRTRSKALAYLVDKIRGQNIEKLAIFHGSAPDIEEFLDMVGEVYPREDIIVGEVGSVVGTHAGPRVMGVGFSLAR